MSSDKLNLATLTFYVGILSFIVNLFTNLGKLLALVGIVLGVIALVKIKDDSTYGSKNKAIIGLALSIVIIVWFIATTIIGLNAMGYGFNYFAYMEDKSVFDSVISKTKNKELSGLNQECDKIKGTHLKDACYLAYVGGKTFELREQGLDQNTLNQEIENLKPVCNKFNLEPNKNKCVEILDKIKG